MILSKKWLNDYCKIDIDNRVYAEALTMSGSKVETWEEEAAGIHKVVVGQILSIEKHPDADKLVVCQVDVAADEPLQIVTGASNLKVGDKVPVALDGSTLPNGTKIKKGKLRGVVSNGMLCSLGELNLTVHDFPYAIEDGIFVIEEDCKLGQDICSAIGLDDTAIEFEITSNRPDCLSVIGLARETAATFQLPLTLPEPKVEKTTGDIGDLLSVKVEDPDLCLRYTARMVKNVRIKPSPRWLRERLRASGVRPINNIVDITNFVMLEYGQPMHAFDYKYVKGGQIIARRAKEGETIMTLDGVERSLTPEMLVICDAEKPAAVAGVMGGEYSGIMDDTDTIVFESANFHGASVRRTAKALGMRTESSARFEKGLCPDITIPAVERACQLVELLDAGDVIGGIIDVDHADHTPVMLPLAHDWINDFLGADIPKEEMVAILTRIGFTVDDDIVTVPAFRTDIECKADVAEEIARFYGYNNLPSTLITGFSKGGLTPRQTFDKKAAQTLQACGLYEVMTYSFISPKYYDKINLPADSALRDSVRILNPLGEDTSVMRTTPMPSMLETLSRNYNNRNLKASLYEMATIYRKTGEDTLPEERDILTIGLYGDDADFYALKGVVEQLCAQMSVPCDYTANTGDPSFHPYRTADLSTEGKMLGILGEVHPAVLANYGIDAKAYIAMIDMDTLYAHAKAEKEYAPLPKFPAVTRDLALVCDEDLPVGEIRKVIEKQAGKLLESLTLFDVYQGQQIEEGKKSVAYSLTLRAADRTLTDQDVDRVVKKSIDALSSMNVLLRM